MINPKRKIELLCPARDYRAAIAAVDCGADALYIGAEGFGARRAATNSTADIARVVDYAHLYGVRVYVTLNTILYESELKEAEALARELIVVGVDALIVQDMAYREMNLPVELHASTQVCNMTPEGAKFLEDSGFTRVILERALSLDEIKAIRNATTVDLECFVHGAICVGHSGRCFLSRATSQRSGNRGECSQPCRLPYDLKDERGRTLLAGKHLLSVRDMDLSDDLEALMDAGITSFKIEGRLKDVSYVKNVTAYYRQAIDAVLARRPEYERASQGVSTYTFTPQLDKSFNRGFTDYYLMGRRTDVSSFATPKAMGEPVGHVKEVGRGYVAVSSTKAFHNGDGLCFIDEQGRLHGFRVNRVEGTRLYPKEMPHAIRPRMPLYRNFDKDFEHLLARPSAERKIPVRLTLNEVSFGFSLTITDEKQRSVTVNFERDKELARTEQRAGIENQLSKLGGTILVAKDIEVCFTENWFIPSSVVADMRRAAVEAYERMLKMTWPTHVTPRKVDAKALHCAEGSTLKPALTYLANVGNRRAEEFYRACGVEEIAPAYELSAPRGATLMFCRHCLRYALGWCPRHGGVRSPYREPYTLVSADGRRFALEFDCKQCIMTLKGK